MSEYPVLNLELIDKVLQHIENDPKHWSQNVWRTGLVGLFTKDKRGREILPVDCGTAFCFAGWACQIGSEGKGAAWASTDELWANRYDKRADVFDGVIEAELRGRRLLGLTETEASTLFDGDNDLRDIRAILKGIKAGKYRP